MKGDFFCYALEKTCGKDQMNKLVFLQTRRTVSNICVKSSIRIHTKFSQFERYIFVPHGKSVTMIKNVNVAGGCLQKVNPVKTTKNKEMESRTRKDLHHVEHFKKA